MNLGLFAGGVAKGYTEAEQLRLKKLQEQRATEEHERKQKTWNQEDRYNASPIRMAGELTTDDYDAAAAIKEAQSKIGLPKDDHPKGGLARMIGGVARAFSQGTEPAAVAAGVKQPPALGLPAPQEAAAQPETPGVKPAAEPEVAEIIGVAPRRGPRITTLADSLKDDAIALQTSGAPRGQVIGAMQKWHEQATKENIAMLVAGSPAQMTKSLNAMGQDVDIMKDPDKEGGFLVVSADGSEQKFANRDKLAIAMKASMDGDVGAAVTANLAFATADRQDRLASLTYQKTLSDIRNDAQRTKNDGARVALAGRQDAREQENHEAAKATKAAVDNALNFLADEDNAVLYPAQWQAATAVATQAIPTLAKGTNKRGTDSSTVNTFTNRQAELTEQFNANEHVRSQRLSKAQGKDGSVGYKVLMPDGKYQGFKTFAEADLAADRAYRTQAPRGGGR